MQHAGTELVQANVSPVGAFAFEVHQYNDPYISGEIRRSGCFEPFEVNVFSRLIKKGHFVIDIGANIGWYTVIGSFLLEGEGRIIAVEPEPNNVGILKRNVARHDNAQLISVVEGAASNHIGPAQLHLSGSNLGDHRIRPDGTDRDRCTIDLVTLDALLSGLDRLPDIAKVDTQGAEALILDGARDLLSKGWRPIWLLEFWPYGLIHAESNAVDLWHKLNGLGYSMLEVSEAFPRLVPFTIQRMDERLASDIAPETKGHINLLAIPDGLEPMPQIHDLMV